jgi:hypothetical protein
VDPDFRAVLITRVNLIRGLTVQALVRSFYSDPNLQLTKVIQKFSDSLDADAKRVFWLVHEGAKVL